MCECVGDYDRHIRDNHIMWGDQTQGQSCIIVMPSEVKEELLSIPRGYTASVSHSTIRDRQLGNAWHGSLVRSIGAGVAEHWRLIPSEPKMVVTPFSGIELLMWALSEAAVLNQVYTQLATTVYIYV